MLHAAYRFLKLTNPSSARVFADWHLTLGGQRDKQLRQWLESYLAHSRPSNLPFEHTLGALQKTPNEHARIAFISVLPPSETGVAIYSLRAWLGSNDKVDVLCPVTDDDWFFAHATKLDRESHGSIRVFDVKALASVLTLNSYKSIVIVIGNSPHHMYVFDVLKKISALGLMGKSSLYLHDVCLLSLLFDATGIGVAEFIEVMHDVYGERVPLERGSIVDKWTAINRLVSGNVLGPRFFFSRFGIRRFLVNSAAAKELCAAEIGDSSVVVERLFLPAPVQNGKSQSDGGPRTLLGREITIGTFGVPSVEKRTDVVLSAMHELRRQGFSARLLLVGFGCGPWANEHRSALSGIRVEVRDTPDEREFNKLMSATDIAIQLRARNLGESSGVVPELLALGRNVIVSDVGAFEEFGDAVCIVPENARPKTVADAVVKLVRAPISRDAIDAYIRSHTGTSFRARLFEVLASDPYRENDSGPPISTRTNCAARI